MELTVVIARLGKIVKLDLVVAAERSAQQTYTEVAAVAGWDVVAEVQTAAVTHVLFVKTSREGYTLVIYVAEIIHRAYADTHSLRYKIVLRRVQTCA